MKNKFRCYSWEWGNRSGNINNSFNQSNSSEEEIENANHFDNDDYKVTGLYERLLKDKIFIQYKDLVLDLKNNTKPKKHLDLDNESDDEFLLNIIDSINKKKN